MLQKRKGEKDSHSDSETTGTTMITTSLMILVPFMAVIFKLMGQKSKCVIFADLIGFSSDTEQAVFHA